MKIPNDLYPYQLLLLLLLNFNHSGSVLWGVNKVLICSSLKTNNVEYPAILEIRLLSTLEICCSCFHSKAKSLYLSFSYLILYILWLPVFVR